MPVRLATLNESLDRRADCYKRQPPVLSRRQEPTDMIKKYDEADEAQRNHLAFSMTKPELLDIIAALPAYVAVHPESEAAKLLMTRYRKYVFRQLYITWQDHYRNQPFCRIFATLLDSVKSQRYSDECGFIPQTLKEIVLSDNPIGELSGHIRFENLSLFGFFDVHYILKNSQLALDSMSIFYLFCSSKDYFEIGDQRLAALLQRFSERYLVKILKNLLDKISPESLRQFPNTMMSFPKELILSSQGQSGTAWSALSESSMALFGRAIEEISAAYGEKSSGM